MIEEKQEFLHGPVMEIHLGDPKRKRFWYGVSLRYQDGGEPYIFHTGKMTSIRQRAVDWINWEMNPESYRPSPWGVLAQANNSGQVKEWVEAQQDMSEMMSKVRAERLRLEAERLLTKASVLDSLPEEPEADPALIYFQKQFNRDGAVYTYAAVKTNAGWCITGSASPNFLTWSELVNFIASDDAIEVPEIWLAESLTRL